MIKYGITALGVVGVMLLALNLNVGKSAETKSTKTEVVTAKEVADAKAATNDVKIPLVKVKASETNAILLDTEVTDESVDVVIDKLNELSSPNKKVYLIITSPGGSVIAGNKLIAYIDNSEMDIITVCQQVCASMGFHIFESGKTRYMVGHSILMAHPPTGGARGTLPEMLSQIDGIKRLTDELDIRTAKRAKLSYDKFSVDVLKNLWVTSNESYNMGLSDGLIHISMLNKSKAFSAQEELLKRGVEVESISEALPMLYEIH